MQVTNLNVKYCVYFPYHRKNNLWFQFVKNWPVFFFFFFLQYDFKTLLLHIFVVDKFDRKCLQTQMWNLNAVFNEHFIKFLFYFATVFLILWKLKNENQNALPFRTLLKIPSFSFLYRQKKKWSKPFGSRKYFGMNRY